MTISEDEFEELLRSFERSAFRLETQPFYALDYEREEFERFLAGSPRPPSEIGWWKQWLDQITALTRQGKSVSRVRVLSEPPTSYQRWMLWADPWYASASENIRFTPRSQAERIGLPLEHDWWLLDDSRVIVMRFTSSGEVTGKELVTDPAAVAPYRAWRDLALAHAIPAAQMPSPDPRKGTSAPD